MNARELHRVAEPDPGTDAAEPGRTRVVYTEAPILLGTVVREEGGAFVVRLRGGERTAALDPSVDPALVRQAMVTGARVVLEPAPEPVVVGVLMTALPVTVDREGVLRAEVERIELTAKTSALVKTAGAFLKLDGKRIEQFAGEIHTRGRDMVRFLAAVIRLN